MGSRSNDALGNLLEVAREQLLLKKAAGATREELEKERKVAAERESALLEKAAGATKEELEKERKVAVERESVLLEKAVALTRSRGHHPKGGYDVPHGQERRTPTTAQVQ